MLIINTLLVSFFKMSCLELKQYLDLVCNLGSKGVGTSIVLASFSLLLVHDCINLAKSTS